MVALYSIARPKLVLLSATVLLVLRFAEASWGSHDSQPPGGAPHAGTPHARTELVQFPYHGFGDDTFSFHSPFVPSPTSPVANWRQEGATLITAVDGRDVVRLTNSAPGLQGVLRSEVRTQSSNFNGYFDAFLGSHANSAEPADGMGFFFADRSPGIGSAMGVEHTFRGLGIIIDTYSNSRKRHMPYVYAYVSDGGKAWNPDRDGADVEITPGCSLQMNVPVRVFVQMLDMNLHVAVSINHQPMKTCFRYNNVPMPFQGGGYFAFSGETGHYFGYHDLHLAAFVVGDEYQPPPDFPSQSAGATDSQPNVAGTHSGLHDERSATAGSVTVAPAVMLGSEMDVKIHQLYMEMTDAMTRSSGGGSASQEVVRKSLEEMSSLTAHSFLEIERMTQETADAARTVQRLKEDSISLHSYAERFSASIGTLHDSIHTLRSTSNRFRSDQEETHNVVLAHRGTVDLVLQSVSEGAPHGIMSILLFTILQLLVSAGFLVVWKMGPSRAKSRRMV